MQELYASKIPEIKTLGQSDKVELRAMVKACLPGGRQRANLDAEKACSYLATYHSEIEAKIHANEDRLAEHERHLSKLPNMEKWRMGGGLAGWGIGEKGIEREAYQMKIRKRQNYGKELAEIVEDIQSLDVTMKALMEASDPASKLIS